jgi:hypothetical protein
MSLQAGLRKLEPTGTLLPLIIDIIDVDDALRPVDTSGFKKLISEQPYDFPNFYVDAPVRVMLQDPMSTTAEYQNTDFMRRYLKN